MASRKEVERKAIKLITKKLHIVDIPPYKQAPADIHEKENQKKRAEALKTEAEKLFENPMRGKVHLKVEYHRHKGRSDAANIIGGIADALNKIAYVDDKQIVEIHYHEALGKVDEYWVEIDEVI